MLFFVYRSVLTTLLVLATVLIEMSAARGLVAFLGNAGVIGLSTYATNLLTLLVIAAGTDYAIFFVGRYQEARGTGEDREKLSTPCITARRTSSWGPGSPWPARSPA